MSSVRSVRWLALSSALLFLAACSCAKTPGPPPSPAATSKAPAPDPDPAPLNISACLANPPAPVDPVRKVSGNWFPADRAKLEAAVSKHLKAAVPRRLSGRIVALLSPHAGFRFSGPVAANAYRQLCGLEVDTVILVGPSHRHPLDGMSVVPRGSYETPFGPVLIDEDAAKDLIGNHERIRHVPEAHAREHALQNQLPFLQAVLPEFRIVPVLIHAKNPDDYVILSEALHWVAGESKKKMLLVASADLSHFPAYDGAQKADRELLEAFRTLDPRFILRKNRAILARRLPGLECTTCGLDAVVSVTLAARALGANRLEVLDARNSYDTARLDKNRVVGYGACVFLATDSEGLSVDGKKRLLEIARKTLKAVLAGKPIPKFNVDEAELKAHGGAFVTLRNGPRLRGCIGRYPVEGGKEPLFEVVAEMAQAASRHDRRFAHNPVTLEELEDLHVEISVLSLPRKVKSADDIVLGKHGVIVKKGYRQGTYLPQVALDRPEWSKEDFLRSLTRDKAGLPPDAWKTDPEVELWVYEVEVIE